MSRMLDLAKEHAAAEDRCDVAATVATFTDDCVYTIDTLGVDLKGKAQVSQHYQGAFESFDNFVNKEVIWFDAGADIFARAYVEFTHGREWAGLAATGRKIGFWSLAHFPGAPDGKLKGEHVYMNGNELLWKLGALPSASAFEIAAHIRTLQARVAELEKLVHAKR